MFLHVKLCEIMSSNIKKKLRIFFSYVFKFLYNDNNNTIIL